MRMKIILVPFLIILSIQIHAQELTLTEKNNALSVVMEKIKRIYPFPEVSEKTITGLQTQYSNGFYDRYNSPNEFASVVTNSLEEFSNDKHLDLIYNPGLAKSLLEDSESDDFVYTAEEAKIEVWNNYGFKELSILDGNVGYLNLSVFFATHYAGKAADNAMSFFSNCNALIIDLRQNGGGWDDMVNYLLGYFIDIKEPLLRDISLSTLDSTYYSAVIPNYVSGKKLIDIPIYVLTSQATASAAECFAFYLRFFNKNVTIIGKKTAGAENPVTHIAIDDNFVLQIPGYKKIYSSNPNIWEGIGINPDIEVEAENAKRIAYLNALKKLTGNTKDEAANNKYQWAIDGLNASYNNVDKRDLIKYSGNYDKIIIRYRDNKLYYQNKERPETLLIPISDNYFVVEGIEYFRLKFILTDGSIILKLIYTYGMEREYLKSK